jgi:hypothetical protein
MKWAPRRLKHKVAMFYGIYFFGWWIPIAIATWLFGENGGLLATIGLTWFFVFAVLQFILFNCPHCGRCAIVTSWPLFVGDFCGYCGTKY